LTGREQLANLRKVAILDSGTPFKCSNVSIDLSIRADSTPVRRYP